MAGMANYLVKRSIQAVITILIVTSIMWGLFEAMPGSPIDRFIADPTTTPARLEQLNETFGLNKPLWERYLIYMKNMLTFEFGPSYTMHTEVSVILGRTVPRTLALFGTATIIAYFLGILIGSFIAWKRGGIAEASSIVTSLIFYNMPSFWIGLIFIWIFSFNLGLFPLGGWITPGMEKAAPLPFLMNFIWHMTLPLIVMVFITLAGTVLLMRTSLLEVMGEDYILTAKAKGLPERIVRRKHANRNAYLPIVTSFTIAFAYAIGGAIILEQIFSYHGVGFMYLFAMINQDQFLAGATLYIISLLVIFGNIVADMLYGFLDPRVRL